MRQGQSNRRPRGRNTGGGRRPNVPNRNQSFDSNGPDVRIRGNAFQVLEKYQALARDASASGDHVMAENYYQHAEHYQRILNQMNEQSAQNQQQTAQNAEGEDRREQTQGGRRGERSDQEVARGEAQPIRARDESATQPQSGAAEEESRPREQAEPRRARAPRPRRAAVSQDGGAPDERRESAVTAAAETLGDDPRQPDLRETAAEQEAPPKRRPGRPRRIVAPEGVEPKVTEPAVSE